MPKVSAGLQGSQIYKNILQFGKVCDKNKKISLPDGRQGGLMREHLGFLKTSSVVVKIAAWIFLFLGLIGGVAISSGNVPDYPRWMGLVIVAIYAFSFFFLYLIAKIADLLIKIINEIKKV